MEEEAMGATTEEAVVLAARHATLVEAMGI